MSNTYNYGIISGGTGSFGSIQYTSDGAGGTKEIMATGSTGPKMHNLMSVSASAALEAGASTLGSLKVSDLTSGRLVFAGANGELQDDSDLTFSTDTLTATKIGAFEAAGAINFANQDMTNVDIDSGAIDGTTIGAASAAAGSFTSLTATSADVNGAADVSNTLYVGGAASFAGALSMTGTLTAKGDVDLGDATSDTITATGRFDSDLVPSTDSARDLGSSALQWAELHVDEANIDSLGSALDANSQAITNINVDSGAIDGTTIGANAQAAAEFTTVSGSGAFQGGGAATFAGAVTAGSSFIIGNADLNETDMEKLDGITDGTVAANKAVVVDASKDASGMRNLTGTGDLSFATLTATGNGSISGSLHVLGNIDVEGNINSVTKTETTLEVVDKLVIVASGSSAANSDGGGLQFGGYKGSDSVASVLYDNANSAIDFNIGGTTEVRLADGVFRPETDDDVDLGASGAEFKDLYLDGVAYIDSLQADSLGAHLDANSKNITGAGDLYGSAVSGSTSVQGGAATFASATIAGTLTANGNIDLGSDSSDTISANGQFDTDLVPSSDDTRDLGSSTKQWKDLYVDGIAYIDQLGTEGDKIAAVYATNVYTGDFHMKNERGDWTLFEESDYLRIRNNKTGQEFKMDMTPISED